MSHLAFRRDITMHLLCEKPRTVSRPGPRSHLLSEARCSRGHHLQSSSQSVAMCSMPEKLQEPMH
ncbi:hypothetical protein T10_3247 [Trichinella papuae]|uniref:Uncharacterized protein n=1 Tax=Trichinella papuae TaxID=268474 RepID=A0A0V1MGM6_9BILA|nr:hypothetical protein T10_3247 [Trichinella papuae]